MSFQADYPDAIVFPSHQSNYYLPENHGGIENHPRAFILHTPEEPWDDNESTPNYFAAPNRQASTHYYMDSDGDVYQLVPERCAAIANGLWGKPLPSWALPSSLNWQTLSVEIEGYASQIQNTLIPYQPQFNGLVKLIRHRCTVWNIPIDRIHIMGHYQLSVDRTDPGVGFPWQELMLALQGEEEMTPDIIRRKGSHETYSWYHGAFRRNNDANDRIQYGELFDINPNPDTDDTDVRDVEGSAIDWAKTKGIILE